MKALLCQCGQPLSLVISPMSESGLALVVAACCSAGSCGFRTNEWMCDTTPESVQGARDAITQQLRGARLEGAA